MGAWRVFAGTPSAAWPAEYARIRGHQLLNFGGDDLIWAETTTSEVLYDTFEERLRLRHERAIPLAIRVGDHRPRVRRTTAEFEALSYERIGASDPAGMGKSPSRSSRLIASPRPPIEHARVVRRVDESHRRLPRAQNPTPPSRCSRPRSPPISARGAPVLRRASTRARRSLNAQVDESLPDRNDVDVMPGSR